MSLKVKVGTDVVEAKPKIKVNGSWVDAISGFVKVDGSWQEFYRLGGSGDDTDTDYIVKYIATIPGNVYLDSTSNIEWYQGYVPELPDTSNIAQPASVMTFDELSQFVDNALDNIIDNMPNGQLLGYTFPLTSSTTTYEYRHEPIFSVSPDGVSLAGTYTTLVDAMSAIESLNSNEPSYILVALRHMMSTSDSVRSPGWAYLNNDVTLFEVNLGAYFFSIELQTSP